MAIKTTILRIILLFLFTSFFALDAVVGQTTIGIKGGVNFCNETWSINLGLAYKLQQ